jgi:hypothetical protein
VLFAQYIRSSFYKFGRPRRFQKHDAPAIRPRGVQIIRRGEKIIARLQMVFAEMYIAFQYKNLFAAGMRVQRIRRERCVSSSNIKDFT